jgi:hypothetical protein
MDEKIEAGQVRLEEPTMAKHLPFSSFQKTAFG